jgi:uncharacterized membrane protein
MTRNQQPALTLFAIGMIGLGILALIYGDFALVWQPVASWIPGRATLAYISGLVMLLGGAGLFFRAAAALSLFTLLVWGPAILPRQGHGCRGRLSSSHG